jgi:hypothetical protein
VSIAVDLARLRDEAAKFVCGAFLVTVREDQRPHVVSIAPTWEGDQLLFTAGRSSAANVSSRGDATLLWPAAADGEHSLLVDGSASVRQGVDGQVVVVKPAKAVLHRMATPAT